MNIKMYFEDVTEILFFGEKQLFFTDKHVISVVNPLSHNPTKWSNRLALKVLRLYETP